MLKKNLLDVNVTVLDKEQASQTIGGDGRTYFILKGADGKDYFTRKGKDGKDYFGI